MDNLPTPPQPPVIREDDTSIETVQWFNTIPSPTVQPPKKKFSVKVVILCVAIGLLAVSGVAALLLNQNSAQCLTTDDLIVLTKNTEVDPVNSPTDYFLNYTVEFQPDSDTYNNTEASTQETIQLLADFYKQHPESSIIFTLTSAYFNTTNAENASRRIAKLQSDLIAAGVPENTITTEQPTEVEAENESEQATTVTIAITSAATCRQ